MKSPVTDHFDKVKKHCHQIDTIVKRIKAGDTLAIRELEWALKKQSKLIGDVKNHPDKRGFHI